MVTIRPETTINQLMLRSFQRRHQNSDSNQGLAISAEKNIKHLLELINTDSKVDLHLAASFLGKSLNDLFDIVEDLGLDPAGCMILAEKLD